MGPLVQRLYEQELTHRLVPWPVARKLLATRAARAWETDAELREQARWHIRYLLGRTDRAGEIDEVAQRYVIEVQARLERYNRPWLVPAAMPTGVSTLRDLQASGRGVLLSYFHHGDHVRYLSALCASGIPIQFPASTSLVDSTVPGSESGYLRTARIQTNRLVNGSGGKMFDAVGSREHIRKLLADGQVVGLASDMPGTSMVKLLGREVALAAGAARLALETGAMVVPLTVTQPGREQVPVLEEPIDPRDETDPMVLLQKMVDRQEPSLLAWPEGVERPLRRWNPGPDDIAEFGAIHSASLKI